jgi:alcohol dehydrogenase
MHQKDCYSFFNQSKYIAGARALEHLPIELHGYDAFRPLVIANRDVTAAGLKKTFIRAFYDSDITLGGFYDNVVGPAPIGAMKDLTTLYRDRGCDSIIAVGYGPAMVTARGLNMMISLNTDDIIALAGRDTIARPLKPFFTVPTAGSWGYDMANRTFIENREFRSDYLYPDVVCLDPRMTVVKDRQRAVESAMVALTHAMESSDTTSGNPMNDAYSLAAIQFIHENLPVILKRPGNRKAGLALAYAGALAAVAFSNAPAGTAHLLGEALWRLTGTAPGLCMGILLPHAVDFMIDKKILMRKELLLAQAGMDVDAATPDTGKIDKSAELLKKLIASAEKHIPRGLAGLRIPGYIMEQAARMAEAAGAHGLNHKDYMAILTSAGGEPAAR